MDRTLTLSIAYILKNESKNIIRSLESVKFADEIICVIDTDTTDDTAKLIQEWKRINKKNVIIYYSAFQGMASQRNFALRQCSKDYILIIDADETLEYFEHGEGDYSIATVENVGAGYFPAIRYFKNNIGIKYEGSIQATPDKSCIGKQIGTAKIQIKHYGYILTPEEQEIKTRNNLQLHLKQLEEEPENLTVEYYLANCYHFLKEYQNAIDYAFIALDKLPRSDMKAILYILLFNCYNALGKRDIAVRWLCKSIETEPVQILGRMLYIDILNQNGADVREYFSEVEKIIQNKNSKLPNDYYYNQAELNNLRSKYYAS